MSRNILVVNGHPDPRPERFCAALCDAYAAGAEARGCATRRLDVGALNLPAPVPANDAEPWDSVEQAFRLVRAADRLAIIYPLWADGPPAELNRLFDYVARLGKYLGPGSAPSAKAAKVLVTTSLPALLYRSKLKPLALSGVDTGEPTFIGSVDAISVAQRMKWLEDVQALGARCTA